MLGNSTLLLSSAQLGKLVADETEKWGKVIRAGRPTISSRSS